MNKLRFGSMLVAASLVAGCASARPPEPVHERAPPAMEKRERRPRYSPIMIGKAVLHEHISVKIV